MERSQRVRGIESDATDAARQLRSRQTPAEEVLWQQLRGRRLAGLKFRRQQPLGPYIVDFCCAEHRLVIELDGALHDAQCDHDAARTEHLQAYGYAVVRFRNEQVLNDLEAVLKQIKSIAGTPFSRGWERGPGVRTG